MTQPKIVFQSEYFPWEENGNWVSSLQINVIGEIQRQWFFTLSGVMQDKCNKYGLQIGKQEFPEILHKRQIRQHTSTYQILRNYLAISLLWTCTVWHLMSPSIYEKRKCKFLPENESGEKIS